MAMSYHDINVDDKGAASHWPVSLTVTDWWLGSALNVHTRSTPYVHNSLLTAPMPPRLTFSSFAELYTCLCATPL